MATCAQCPWNCWDQQDPSHHWACLEIEWKWAKGQIPQDQSTYPCCLSPVVCHIDSTSASVLHLHLYLHSTFILKFPFQIPKICAPWYLYGYAGMEKFCCHVHSVLLSLQPRITFKKCFMFVPLHKLPFPHWLYYFFSCPLLPQLGPFLFWDLWVHSKRKRHMLFLHLSYKLNNKC